MTPQTTDAHTLHLKLAEDREPGIGRLVSEGLWVRDCRYGWGIHVGRPFDARRIAPEGA